MQIVWNIVCYFRPIILARRWKKMRELVVKRSNRVENLLKRIDGDWKKSSLAGSISYWQTKIYLANRTVHSFLLFNDRLAYIVACINGTVDDYVVGSANGLNLNDQSNYVCLRNIANQDEDTLACLIKQRTMGRTSVQSSDHWQHHVLRIGSIDTERAKVACQGIFAKGKCWILTRSYKKPLTMVLKMRSMR